MNAIRPAIGIALVALLLIAFLIFKRPSSDSPGVAAGPADKRPGTELNALPASSEQDRQIRTILREPNAYYRRPLLRGFFHTLEAEEFPAAFDSLTRTLDRQRSRDYTYLLRVWTEKDPQGAWEFIRPLFAGIAPNRWADSWEPGMDEKRVTPPRDLAVLQSLAFWPDRSFFEGFESGLRRTDLPAPQKSQLARNFEEQFREHFDPDYAFPPFADPTSDDEQAREFLLAKQVWDAGKEVLPQLAAKAREQSLPIAFGIALRRLVELDPAQATAALQIAATHASSEESQERLSQEYVVTQASADIARAWTQHDPVAAWEWFSANEADSLLGFAGEGMIPFLDERHRSQLLERALAADDAWHRSYKRLIQNWATTDLPGALESASEQLDDESFTDLLFSLEDYDLAPSGWGPLLETLDSLPVRLEDETMAQLMEDIGDWDAAATARFGVRWLLDRPEHRARSLEVWSGEANPIDGLISDRTFGCLRCWALAQPSEMQSWIQGQQDPEVRASLQWLFDHAACK